MHMVLLYLIVVVVTLTLLSEFGWSINNFPQDRHTIAPVELTLKNMGNFFAS